MEKVACSEYREITDNIILIIRAAFEETNLLPFSSPFGVLCRKHLDERIQSGEGLPNESLKSLWWVADEYFDSAAHGFDDSIGLPINVGRDWILAALLELEMNGYITDEHILSYSKYKDPRKPGALSKLWISWKASKVGKLLDGSPKQE